jgi:glucose-1-phosphate adenylyltransferase
MDLLKSPTPFDLYDRSWVIHTRTEERPPVHIDQGALIEDSLICDGCTIESGARVVRSILSPGARIKAGATVIESIILTDALVDHGASIIRSVLDKHSKVFENARVGDMVPDSLKVSMVGKHATIPANTVVEAGAIIGPNVIPEDYSTNLIQSGQYLSTKRLPYEI